MGLLNTVLVLIALTITPSEAICRLPPYYHNRVFLKHSHGNDYSKLEFRGDAVVTYTRRNRAVDGRCRAVSEIGRRFIYLKRNGVCMLITPMTRRRAVLVETKANQRSVTNCNSAASTGTHYSLFSSVSELDNHIACPFNSNTYQATFTDSAGTEHCVGDRTSTVTVAGSNVTFHVCSSATTSAQVTRPATVMHCADDVSGSYNDARARGGILLLHSFRNDRLYPVTSHCATYTINGGVVRISMITSRLAGGVSAYCKNDQSATTSNRLTFALKLTAPSNQPAIRRTTTTSSPWDGTIVSPTARTAAFSLFGLLFVLVALVCICGTCCYGAYLGLKQRRRRRRGGDSGRGKRSRRYSEDSVRSSDKRVNRRRSDLNRRSESSTFIGRRRRMSDTESRIGRVRERVKEKEWRDRDGRGFMHTTQTSHTTSGKGKVVVTMPAVQPMQPMTPVMPVMVPMPMPMPMPMRGPMHVPAGPPIAGTSMPEGQTVSLVPPLGVGSVPSLNASTATSSAERTKEASRGLDESTILAHAPAAGRESEFNDSTLQSLAQTKIAGTGKLSENVTSGANNTQKEKQPSEELAKKSAVPPTSKAKDSQGSKGSPILGRAPAGASAVTTAPVVTAVTGTPTTQKTPTFSATTAAKGTAKATEKPGGGAWPINMNKDISVLSVIQLPGQPSGQAKAKGAQLPAKSSPKGKVKATMFPIRFAAKGKKTPTPTKVSAAKAGSKAAPSKMPVATTKAPPTTSGSKPAPTSGGLKRKRA